MCACGGTYPNEYTLAHGCAIRPQKPCQLTQLLSVLRTKMHEGACVAYSECPACYVSEIAVGLAEESGKPHPTKSGGEDGFVVGY